MSSKRIIGTSLAAVGLSLAMVGCTTNRSVHHFSPSPAARVRSQELGPAKPQLVSELLRSAQQEFEAANAAQEGGGREAAIQHYAKMLDLLRQANLDPSAFYSLRAEFERIIHSAAPDGAHSAQESQPAAPPPESETA